MKLISVFLILGLLLAGIQCQTYSRYFEEAKKIVGSMTLDQKIGQIMQIDFYAITTDQNGTDAKISEEFNIGSLLVGGNGAPDDKGNLGKLPDNQADTKKFYASATGDKWKKLGDKFLSYTMDVKTSDSTYKVKAILATDAVHNNQHVSGTVLFPHNIGLSCSHNEEHFYSTGYWTGKNVKETGFNYAFAPTVAVSHNPQWGRFYETMGSQPEYIKKYGKSYTEGLQQMKDGKVTSGVIGSVKHFIGDGATLYGADEGNDNIGSYKAFIEHNVQGYIGSIQSGIGTVMCSYSGINWVPMSVGPQLGVILRQKLGFDGFVISDYDQISKTKDQQLPTDFQKMQFVQSITMTFNAGIDMFMFPSFYGTRVITDFIQTMKEALDKDYVPMERLDQAVIRIMAVKMAMGLVEKSNSENLRQELDADKGQEKSEVTHATSEYEDSLSAVH